MRIEMAIAMLVAAATAIAQQPAHPAAFEVASVKTAAEPDNQGSVCLIPCTPGERLTVDHSRVDIRYMSLRQLTIAAYGIQSYQLSGPDWMASARFDIAARMPAGATRDQLPEMLQALLAERFKLTIHRENRELPVYALEVGKSGPKLQESKTGDIALPDGSGSRELYTPQGEAGMSADGSFVAKGGPLGPIRGGPGPGGIVQGGLIFEFLDLTMQGLADLLIPHVDRPVIDQTGVKGGYYFKVVNRPPEGAGRKGDGATSEAGARRDAMGDALFDTIEKAGLKLEKTKAGVATIVVDRIEKTPTEN